MKLWIFGDSFSQKFSDFDQKLYDPIDYRVRYHIWKGYSPKCYGEIISDKLECDLEILASAGNSNDEIFHSFIEVMDQIQYGDIVIINWTYPNRFRIADNNNKFEKIMIQAGCKSPNRFVSEKSLEEIGVNRNSSSIYYKEVSNYTKIIKKVCGEDIFSIFWYFSNMDIQRKYDENIISFFENVIPLHEYETLTIETLGVMEDGHYSEDGHKDLANDLYKIIEIWTQTKQIK
jgi:hypothetical protein